ncbi:hypothetical protein [Candidatus Nitrotoga arctica]|uniref:Chromosome segregation ATPase n=1 Tax=Candidatus Nitrotoga arctica TaxID=453162 RepID=A0ABM8YX32_9PROT|nr:hypothetical protein [Candidatus Nitrotoga arctica]CAG9932036.1 conserved exported protein of unknown function [Candidatus Nitrotoga arctica]
MKNLSKTTTLWTRGLAFAMAFSLCACSVLNIDVDEYKGPLSNHEDIQLQQYAALAISAKPIIVELRSRYISDEDKKIRKHDQDCEKNNYDEYSGCRFELEIVQFLNSILALYEDEHGVFQKESVEVFREENLLIVKGLTQLRSQDKIYFYEKDRSVKQKSREKDLERFSFYERRISNSKYIKEQEQLRGELDSELKHLEVPSKENKLDELKSFFIRNSMLVKQPKTWGIQKAKNIENVVNTKIASDDDEPFDCITQKEKPSDVQYNARDACGINRLATNFIDSINKASASPNEDLKHEVLVAKERLNESLILFAEKILFIVNNHGLAFGNGSTNYDDSDNNHEFNFDTGNRNHEKSTTNGYARKFAVLQSLGNTLIVHANDLRRRATHDQRLVDRKDSELAAAQHAFAPGAQSAFDNLVKDLGAAIKKGGDKEENLQSAINAFSKRNITETSITSLRNKLTEDVGKVRPKLDAYRTAFNDFNVKGIISADSLAADDRNEIAKLFTQTNPKVADPKVKMDAVLTTLKSWFDDKSKTTPQGVLKPSDSKYDRRNNAQTVIGQLTLSIQDLAVEGTVKEIYEKLGDKLLRSLNEDKINLEKEQKTIAEHDKALKTFEENKIELSKMESTNGDLVGSSEIIKSIKETVLKRAETAKVVDFSGLRHVLLLELNEQSASPGESPAEQSKNAKALAAHKLVSAMSIPKSFQFVGGSNVKTQRDVLDDVIAQLQQQRLEAASRGGDITALNKALELAFEQRGGLAYLRTATAYLRNAFANTSMQEGNANCRNLLIPSIFCQDGYDEVFKQTKLEIDKQFWQTINTIKVRGGGATDFAIVKDDVGNWYVKGLSSDPESIIKSAQSLALFNMGGKVNLNLLGQVETRRKLAKLDIGDPNRKTLKDELKEQQSGSGANTAGLEKVLAKYRNEYVSATTMNVNGLIGKLDQLSNDITVAWKDINFGETREANLAKLNGLLVSPAELASAKSALKSARDDLAKATEPAAQASNTVTATAVASTQKEAMADPAKVAAPASSTAKVDIETAKANASSAIIKSLTEVRNMRSRFVKAIIQDDEFIATQWRAYDDAKAKFNAQDVDVTVKKNEWEKANVDVSNKQASHDAMTVPEKITEKRAVLTAAESELKKAQDALDKARNDYDKDVRIAREKLSGVFKRKQDAQNDIAALTAKPQDTDRDKLLDAAKIKLAAAETELVAAEKALADISIPSQEVITKTETRDKATKDLAIQQGIFEGLTASSEIESAKNKLKIAKDGLATARGAWDAANGELAVLRASAKEKDDAYILAKSNRLAAARKVTTLTNSLIEIITTNRLEAVKAYEVAIGFVGQTAGGQ